MARKRTTHGSRRSSRAGSRRSRHGDLTMIQVRRAMQAAKIPGEIRGRGQDWEVELPTEKARKAFRKISDVGGFRTGYGAWILRPGYVSRGDPMDRGSRHHY